MVSPDELRENPHVNNSLFLSRTVHTSLHSDLVSWELEGPASFVLRELQSLVTALCELVLGFPVASCFCRSVGPPAPLPTLLLLIRGLHACSFCCLF